MAPLAMQMFYTTLHKTFWHISISSASLYFVRCSMYLEICLGFSCIDWHLSSYYFSFLQHFCRLHWGKLLQYAL